MRLHHSAPMSTSSPVRLYVHHESILCSSEAKILPTSMTCRSSFYSALRSPSVV